MLTAMTPMFSAADWRAEADRRIREHRTAPHRIHIVDAEGSPLPGADVELVQTGHDFRFGTCVSHEWLARSDAAADSYRSMILRLFNTVVGESSMKWAYTERVQGTHDFTFADQLMNFAEANGLAVRGHTLFWTKIRYKADWVKELHGPPLQAAMENHLRQILPRYRGRLIAWDVINEMITAHLFEERIGPHIRPHIYKLAHIIDPGTPLFTNEYSILCNDKGLEGYLQLLQRLREAEAPVHGIGIQEHAAERIADVRPEGDQMERQSQFTLTPEGIWARLDRLAELGLPIHLTEISFRAEDEEKRAQAVDMFFRTAFAHPAVEVIMLWGFWERSHWLGRPASLFDARMNPLPAGEALLNLLENEWRTTTQAETDASGHLDFHGFYGPYRITITLPDGRQIERQLNHTRSETETRIELQ